MWTYKQFENWFAMIRTEEPRLKSALMRSVLVTVMVCGILTFLPGSAAAQRKDILEVKALKSEIRTRYSLSERELLKIEPLIDQEGRKLIKLYARFSGDEVEYSSRVWDQVIEDRTSFEGTLAPTLTKRQKDAVRAARSRMEKRVLGYLVDDYLNVLSQDLELSDYQSNEVADLLDSDTTRKLQVINVRIGDVTSLQKNLANITEATELSMKKILTAEQWRTYCQMKENGTPVA